MAFRLRERDCITLECLADYRILTVPQLAAIFRKNKQVIRRRFADLEKEGFIEVIKRDFGRARGLSENLLGLTKRGVDVLREKILIGRDVPNENVDPVSNRLIGLFELVVLQSATRIPGPIYIEPQISDGLTFRKQFRTWHEITMTIWQYGLCIQSTRDSFLIVFAFKNHTRLSEFPCLVLY